MRRCYWALLSLVGTIPSSISSLTSLQSLNLDINSLYSTIPSSIGSLTSLQILHFGGNSLAGIIPSSIGLLIKLTSLGIQSNQLSGTIPSTFSKQIILTYIDLEYNYLTMGSARTVPKSTFSSTTLSNTLILSNNCLAFTYGSNSVSVTHCAPTSGKSVILYECVLSSTTAQCLIMI